MKKILIYDSLTGHWEINEVKYPLQRVYRDALVRQMPKKLSLTSKEFKAILKEEGVVIAEKLVIRGIKDQLKKGGGE